MLNRIETPLKACNLKFEQQATINAEDDHIFSGYASVFGGIDSFGDTIMKGAFADTIKAIVDGDARMPLMLYGHNSQQIIGKWLEMREDENGLWVKGQLTPGHTLADDVYRLLKHGALTGMSIGFMIGENGAEELENGGRRITKIDLVEVSIVGFPADDAARIGQVKMSDAIKGIKSIRDAEKFLRDAGLPVSMAKAFLSQCRSMYLREVDEERERMEARKRDLDWLHNLIEKGAKK